jgi:small-conductance mechanosensitive channel
VYNYTREFPYLWDEIRIPVSYNDDRRRAEQILLDAARKHTADIVQECAPALARLEHDVVLHEHPSIEPAVYWRLTDNWLELTLRFVARTHGVRALKNDISREILEQFDHAKIGIASGTYDIVGLPPVRVRIEPTPDSPPRPNVS